VRKGLLFAGSETSVWMSFDDGAHWQSLQMNLPHTSMRDLSIHDSDLIVATHGRSFWILDDITPLRQIREQTAGSSAFLFKPAPAYRVRRDTNTDTPLPPDEPAGENPPDGAVVDYSLAQPTSGEVTLEILDTKGNLVRRYSSTDKPELTEDDLKALAIPPYWVRMPRILPASAGMHRWVWDLHYAPPESLRHEYPISAVPHDTPRLPLGPSVLPGMYTVKLTANGTTYTAPLTVKMDPRVKTAVAGLEQQFEMETQLASMLTRSTEAIRQARAVQEQIEKLLRETSGSMYDSLKAIGKKIEAIELTRVNRQVSALHGDVDSADAAPTAAQIAAMAVIRADFSGAEARWRALRSAEIPALNRELNSAKLPEIRIDEKLAPSEDDDDQDLE